MDKADYTDGTTVRSRQLYQLTIDKKQLTIQVCSKLCQLLIVNCQLNHW